MAYIYDGWYCAGWSKDLTDKPLGWTFLEEPVLIYRKSDGTAAAIGNRCPHRFAPLHLGKLKGDAIECPYHGLQFDSTGKCVHNPHGDGKIPQAAQVRTYPIVERNGALWIWMGDAQKADPAKILEFNFVTDKSYSTATGYLRLPANYLLIIDNLLDLTHAPYLHTSTLAGATENSIGRMEYDFKQDGETIDSNYTIYDMPPAPSTALFFHEPKGDFRAFMHWTTPSSLYLDLSIAEKGRSKEEAAHNPSVHLLVPEDEHVTHYFFATGRNREIDNKDIDAQMLAIAQKAFTQEDEPMIRACQEMMGTTDLFALKPVLLQTDTAAIRARRIVEDLVKPKRVSV